jgi:hypothetical protein
VADLTGDLPGALHEFRAAMHRDAIAHKKKTRRVATGFLVEIGNSLADFELAPNDAS